MGLSPPIPPHFGPYRTAALEESQAGWCAMCDELPVNRKMNGRYTCGRPSCTYAWAYLCKCDQRARERARRAA